MFHSIVTCVWTLFVKPQRLICYDRVVCRADWQCLMNGKAWRSRGHWFGQSTSKLSYAALITMFISVQKLISYVLIFFQCKVKRVCCIVLLRFYWWEPKKVFGQTKTSLSKPRFFNVQVAQFSLIIATVAWELIPYLALWTGEGKLNQASISPMSARWLPQLTASAFNQLG